MGDHVGEEGVAGDVEGHAEAHVPGPLVQLAGQLAVAHVELAQGVAGGQGHVGQVWGGHTRGGGGVTHTLETLLTGWTAGTLGIEPRTFQTLFYFYGFRSAPGHNTNF